MNNVFLCCMGIYFGFGVVQWRREWNVTWCIVCAAHQHVFWKPKNSYINIRHSFKEYCSDSLNTTCMHMNTAFREKKKKKKHIRCFIRLDAISWNWRRILFPQCTLNVSKWVCKWEANCKRSECARGGEPKKKCTHYFHECAFFFFFSCA